MLKFTINGNIYYLKESNVYGFNVFPVIDGYKLRLLYTSEDNYYTLGTFKNEEIYEQIIRDIKKMCGSRYY